MGDRRSRHFRGGFASLKFSRRASTCAVACALLFAILGGTAQAAAPETIAAYGQGAGQVDGPNGVAVDRTSGDLYVADNSNFRVDKFDADGNFLLAWGFGVADGATEALQTCGPQASPPTVQCFRGRLTGGGGTDSNGVFPSGVAVDQSSGAVYATELQRISKYTSSGAFLFTVGRDVNQTKVALGAGATQAERNICTAASGDTCGQGVSGTGPGEFGTATALVVKEAGPNLGRVWVKDNTGRLVSIEPGGTPGPEVSLAGIGETKSVAVDSAGDFYVIRSGIYEWQRVSISGFHTDDPETDTEADTFVLGNLPPSCSASQTAPIAYRGNLGGAFDTAVSKALQEKCGEGTITASGGSSLQLYFSNK